MPRDFSTEVRDFILRLLVKNPRKRLGASGASEVKKHKFFKVPFDNTSIAKKMLMIK